MPNNWEPLRKFPSASDRRTVQCRRMSAAKYRLVGAICDGSDAATEIVECGP